MALSTDPPYILFLGRFISTPTPTTLSIRFGAVLVSRAEGVIEGTNWEIEDVEEAMRVFGMEAKEQEVEVVKCELEHGFFFPGFVDTHIHAPQYPNAGLFGKSTLLSWLQNYTFPIESSLGSLASPMYDPKHRPQSSEPPDPLSRARSVYTRVLSRTLSHGTTTASYYATNSVPATKLLFDLAHNAGQRAFIGRVCMDNPVTCPDYYRDESTEAVMEAEHECLAYARKVDPKGTLIAPIVTPRFAPACTSSTLTALAQLAKSGDLRIQTHISENVSECELVASLFPASTSYAGVYDTHGLLTPRTVLAHAVHLSVEERRLIKERGSGIAHCPASNSALGSGCANVRAMLGDGINVGLGTDVSGGYSASMLEVVRQACLVSRLVGHQDKHNGDTTDFHLSVAEALYLGTVGGAKVLGLEGQIGGFEKGMKFDVQDISLGKGESNMESTNVDMFGWETWEEKIEKWVWGGDDRNVRRVWVGGRCVVDKY